VAKTNIPQNNGENTKIDFVGSVESLVQEKVAYMM
jgi:hypothetical protein